MLATVDTQKFSAALLKNSLNLNEVAALCKLNPLTVQKLSAKNCRVHFRTLAKVSKCLGVEPDSLIVKGGDLICSI